MDLEVVRSSSLNTLVAQIPNQVCVFSFRVRHRGLLFHNRDSFDANVSIRRDLGVTLNQAPQALLKLHFEIVVFLLR